MVTLVLNQKSTSQLESQIPKCQSIKLGILIFSSGTKVVIFYFHYSPWNTFNKII